MIRMTYELVNEQEAECGDTDRKGWLGSSGYYLDDPECMSLRDMLAQMPFIVHVEWQGGTLVLLGESEMQDNGDHETRYAHLNVTVCTANRVLRFIKKHGLGWNFPAVI